MAKTLHSIRSDISREHLVGNVKVTREDWLGAAISILISDGVERVKILTLSEALGVSRSSFYWYFRDRADLLTTLLDHWESKNTTALETQAEAPARSITHACCNVFRCVVNPELFDIALDFAVRDWARRDEDVKSRLLASDTRRIGAICAMFQRFNYAPTEALIRSRVLYYMQNGYNDADLKEPLEERMSMLPHYLFVFTGVEPSCWEIEDFQIYSIAVQKGETS